MVRRTGNLKMRRVNVPELDLRFTEMAETFNEQQEHHEAMVDHIRKLKQSCGSKDVHNLAFAECIGEIRKEHGEEKTFHSKQNEKQMVLFLLVAVISLHCLLIEATHRVSLKMKGYDFSLVLNPVGPEGENEEKPLPLSLQSAQKECRGISDSAKATISKGTALMQLIDWLLRSHHQMAEQVNGAAETYQERGRLNNNLEENMKEVRRAKQLLQGFRQQAGEVYTEAAQIAGIDI